jgi:hypothetical protein
MRKEMRSRPLSHQGGTQAQGAKWALCQNDGMNWGKLLAKLFTAWLVTPRHTTIPSDPPPTGRLPVVTHDMIEPRDKALSRYDIAEAYRDFYIDHFDPPNGHEVQMAYEEVIDSYVSHIEELERERVHTHKRIKLAMRALHAEKNDIPAPENADQWDISYLHDADTIRETIARRTARLKTQDMALAALKADARDFFVWFLNEKIRDHNNRLR